MVVNTPRSMRRIEVAILIAAGATACVAKDGPPAAAATPPVASARAADSTASRVGPGLPPDPLHGLYVNRWAARGDRMWELIDVAKRTEINALVIDVKDDRGLLLYRSQVPMVGEISADTLQPLSDGRVRAILDSMGKYNLFPIARIVVAKDPLLASGKPDFSIKRRDDPTHSWLDKEGRPWLDPTRPEVWQYAADLAAEAVKVGFKEVQFDYVRFPDEDRIIREATYADMKGRVRAEVIRDQLAYLRGRIKLLKVPMTIDVFGLTATDTTDMGIGQRWEDFVDEADVVLPMVYPSHFAPGTYKLANPNAHPYETVDHALKDVIRRSAKVKNAARIVPWYQDFTLGPPHYNAPEVLAQIKAGMDNGFTSWILWNARSDYTLEALRPARSGK